MASDITEAQKAFMGEIEDKVNQLLSSKLDGKFQMVNYPSGFNWSVQFGPNNYYNQKALNEIDLTTDIASNDILTLGSSNFSNLYNQILNTTTYVISEADNKIIQQEEQTASSQISSVITEWETGMGAPITDEMMKEAIPPTKLGYIEMQVQEKWDGDIRKIPNSLAGFKNAYQSYQVAASQSNTILSRSAQAGIQLKASMTNTENAETTNGGMQTGASTYYVGFGGIPAQNMINSGLQTESNKVSVSLFLSEFSSTESKLNISGKAGIRVPIMSFMSISLGGSAEYDLSKYTSSSSSLDIAINYPGITTIGSAPSNLSKEGKTGWYDNQILKEAVANAGKGTSVTGFQIQGSEFPIPDYFGPGKEFSRLKTFVISQEPTISMTFKDANNDKVKSDFKQNASAKVKLFGLFDIGSVSESYEVHNIDENTQEGTVTVTLGPPKSIGTTPAQDSTAYVVGGVASYPPNSI
ncbi:MAG: hypothetical protein K8S56_04015 [Candidatus Cloacimonetes bacterium]|nr:hypothetical protein [Candidatus Cloacimonadota bacterium]